MTDVTTVDLQAAWSDVLRRRATLASSLQLYGDVLRLWASARIEVAPLVRSQAECLRHWETGQPLLAQWPPTLPRTAIEPLLGPLIDVIAAATGETTQLAAFAEAWDAEHLTSSDLLPARGRIGSIDDQVGIDDDLVAFLALGSLRPSLQGYFGACHGQLIDGVWFLGVCPFCGAPPGFSDVMEDGRRRLACHLCGGAWVAARLRCPFCGNDDAKSVVRLEAESAEQGYVVAACRACRGYLKELDRRVRWNGGPALLEDWGSPHFDLAAQRGGYWRAIPTLLELSSQRRSRSESSG